MSFGIMNTSVDPALEEEQGRDKDGLTNPIFYDLITFYMASPDAFVSSDFTATFCVCQGNTRRAQLALRLPACSFMQTSLSSSALES